MYVANDYKGTKFCIPGFVTQQPVLPYCVIVSIIYGQLFRLNSELLAGSTVYRLNSKTFATI